MIREIVLPDGRFAKVLRKPTGRDLAACFNTNPIIMVYCLTAAIVIIDDKPVTLKELLDADVETYASLLTVVNEVLGEAYRFGKGVA